VPTVSDGATPDSCPISARFVKEKMRTRTLWFGSVTALLVVAVSASTIITAHPAAAEVRVIDDVTDARGPSISADGRWVVFSGVVGDRTTVLRTDLTTDTTIELSPVPATVPSGDTIFPQISADGCVVVATTEIAFDLFRDDDRDERWDVYRLVMPECGGQPNGWELVSLSARSGTAIDGVFTDSPPSVSGSGAVIAYTHQSDRYPEGVSTISVVDVTIPVNEPGRVQEVAGLPVEAPNRAYTYRGAVQPALSENGRHLAFVADVTASDALPGWATGLVPGGPATTQVYVWDRGQEDQRRSVHLVSGRDGVISKAGANSPAVSEDGRIIAFVSADRTLVPAVLPRCLPVCATQIYRFDRDTDGNGIFDEAPRGAPLRLVSAIDAGVVKIGLPTAGDADSWDPAVSADGSQVAFVTDAINLQPSRRSGGGEATDGDLLVAEVQLGQIRRVLDAPAAIGVPGAHARPALSQTGQTIVFDTAATGPLTGVRRPIGGAQRSIVAVDVTPKLSLAALDFGTVVLGAESAEMYATVLNSGPASFEPSDLSVTSNFRVTGGTCARGVLVAAGDSCSVHLTFRPTEPRGYSGTLTVSGRGDGAASVTTQLFGAAGEPMLLAQPGGVDLDPAIVGDIGGRVAVDINNIGFLPTQISNLRIAGSHPDDFVIATQACTGRFLNPDASCAVEIEFHPTDSGYRTALLIAGTPQGSYTAAVLGGFARYSPTIGVDEPAVKLGAEYDVEAAARPGGQLGIGGNGFPAGAEVSIGFDDGASPFTTVTATEAGVFLAIIDLPIRTHSGARRLVASAGGGAVVAIPLEILPVERTRVPFLPGYGLG
jgi:Tol biopolymer transport system component